MQTFEFRFGHVILYYVLFGAYAWLCEVSPEYTASGRHMELWARLEERV
jgi:hypothetical protein